MDLVKRFSSIPDYHQLASYARVMEEIGWNAVKVRGGYLFVKPLGPIAFAKFQRPAKIDAEELVRVQKRLRIVRFLLEPGLQTDTRVLNQVGFRVTNAHYAYTKTLLVDLSGSMGQILASLSKTTSYQMRRSLKMGVAYKFIPYAQLSEAQKTEILSLHARWSKEKKVSGYDDTFLRAMWRHMKEGTMILAYEKGILHGALFLLMHHKLGMYFYQFTSEVARKKLYVPSGLAYQAIKLSKEQGCNLFDLCSAYDERYPKENLKWKGFSAHKDRFHPTPVYFPQSYVKHYLPFLG